MMQMSMPAATNMLLTMDHDEVTIISSLSSSRPFLNDCLDFLFKKDPKFSSLFLVSGPLGLFLAGATAHAGIGGVVSEDGVFGNLDPDFKKVVVIVGVMTDDANPIDTWRDVSEERFPHKKTGVFIEIRCLIDDRTDNVSPSMSSVENVEMVSVKSLSSMAPGSPR